MSASNPRPTRQDERLPSWLPPPLLPETPTGPSDDDLMAAFKQGEHTALDTLYARHARGLYLFVAVRCPSPPDADDVFQRTWAQVMEKADQFRGGNFRAWLFKIAFNGFISATRSVKKVKVGDNEPTLDVLASAADGALDHVVREEDRRILEGCVEALTERARHVVRARCDGVPYSEIANYLGNASTANALMQLYFAAVRQLRECVERKSGNPGGQP